MQAAYPRQRSGPWIAGAARSRSTRRDRALDRSAQRGGVGEADTSCRDPPQRPLGPARRRIEKGGVSTVAWTLLLLSGMSTKHPLTDSKDGGLRSSVVLGSRPGSGATLLIGLLILGGVLAYGVARKVGNRESTPGIDSLPPPSVSAARGAPPADVTGAAATRTPPGRPEVAEPEVPGAASIPVTAATAEGKPSGVASDTKAPAPAPAGDSKTVMMKMEPLVANLDEGDQLRYLRISLQLEVATEAQPRAQAALPRARHDALMFLSGLHLVDTHGLLGKQRIHRELQRRIADAIGGGLKRIYFDEFFVQ